MKSRRLGRLVCRKSCLTVPLVFIPLLVSAPSAFGDQLTEDVWGSEPLSLEAGRVLELADLAEAGDDPVVILYSENRFDFDEKGASVNTRRNVYKIVTAAGVEGWDWVSAEWAPWHEERPEIRARVITSDGAVHELDLSHVTEQPVKSSLGTYMDRRALVGPLPAVAQGAVIEELIITKQTAPCFDAGVVYTIPFAMSAPTETATLVVDHPKDLPIHYVVRHLGSIEPNREDRGGRVVLTFRLGRIESFDPSELFKPTDRVRYPVIAFSTAESWRHVASRYAAQVDRQIQDYQLDPSLLQIAQEASSTRDAATALLAWLHGNVRYTGLEFGEAAIVPASPKEVLRRGHGDCKDQAALLTAMLRAAGEEAHVALLQTAFVPPFEEELPGLGSFNHSIVYVEGDPPLWIDPSDPYVQVGFLPSEDQGKAALVAKEGVSELKRTPESSSQENRSVETIEIRLPNHGGAHIVETTTVGGEIARNYRHSYADLDDEAFCDMMQSYAINTYVIEELSTCEHSDFRDLSDPVRIHLEASDSQIALTAEIDAVVALRPERLFLNLPNFFLTPEAAEEEKPENSQDASELTTPSQSDTDETQARDDVVLDWPFKAQLHYTISPPPGYRVWELPQRRFEKIGPAVLSWEFNADSNQVVSGNLVFDSGARRFSKDEAESLRSTVLDIAGAEPLAVQLQQIGEAYLAAGQITEALLEFRKLLEDDPESALHNTRVARALLAVGLGEAARDRARKAVELEPESAVAHRVLGLVLEHDVVSREFEKGFDYDGALAAFRKAHELDPEDALSWASLANLLTYDASGIQHGDSANLSHALSEYLDLREALDDPSNDTIILDLLLRSRQFHKLREFARKADDSPFKRAVLLTAKVETEGLDAAILDVAQETNPIQRRTVLANIGLRLMQMRRYEAAAAALRTAASGASSASDLLRLVNTLEKVRPYEEVSISRDDPDWPIKGLYMEALIGGFDEEDLHRFMSKTLVRHIKADEVSPQDFEAATRVMRTMLQSLDLRPEVIVDFVVSSMRSVIEGDDDIGYQIQMDMLEFSLGSFYIVKEEGSYRILSSNATDELPILGLRALEHLEASQLEGARRWLDWARKAVPKTESNDEFSAHPMTHFWTHDDGVDPTRMSYAAASLLAWDNSTADRALSILKEAREGAAPEDEDFLDLAILQAYLSLKRYDKAAEVARRLLGTHPESGTLFKLLKSALLQHREYEALGEAAEGRLRQMPNDPEALRALARIAMLAEDFLKADSLYRRIIQGGDATANDYNQIAWNAIFTGSIGEDHIAFGHEAVKLAVEKSAELHTLATAYAETGRPLEAKALSLQGMMAAGLDEPDADHWYVFGRIAEHFGEYESARKAYSRTIDRGDEDTHATSTRVLALRRLEILDELQQ